MASPGPVLPFDFAVPGVPVSHQSANKRLLANWRKRVRDTAAGQWATEPLAIPLRIAVTYFHEGAVSRIDADNLLKPIQDALNGFLYVDDALIVDAQVRKVPIDAPIRARRCSLTLLQAFNIGLPFVHVIIDEAPDHGEPLR